MTQVYDRLSPARIFTKSVTTNGGESTKTEREEIGQQHEQENNPALN
jgi:hypothetical protein